MTFSSTSIPRTRLSCWKTKPNVERRTAVRKRSGSREISRPSSRIRPAVGRAMQPTRESSVVLPEPLGPLSTVTRASPSVRLTPSRATNSFGPPSLKTLRTSSSSIIVPLPQDRMTASGSTVAARQVGSTVAAA